jgi:hypothetical protein
MLYGHAEVKKMETPAGPESLYFEIQSLEVYTQYFMNDSQSKISLLLS